MSDEIKLDQKIVKINKKNGNMEYSLLEKLDLAYYPQQEVYVNKTGDVKRIACSEDTISITELNFTKQTKLEEANKIEPKSMVSGPMLSLPTEWDPTRHYNAYLRAQAMVDYEWEFDSATMITKLSSAAETKPPSHLDSGSGKWIETGIPYKWGGKTGLDTKSFGV